MTLKELRYLLAVAQEGHFGRAAKRCHVSQPTLSIAIRKLESDLGVQLLVRAGAGARLTEIGREVARHAVQALQEIQSIRNAVHDAQQSGRVVIPMRAGPPRQPAPH